MAVGRAGVGRRRLCECIVDEVSSDGGAPDEIRDEKMKTWMRESMMMSLAFRPPPNDGWVTVTYPMLFEAGD